MWGIVNNCSTITNCSTVTLRKGEMLSGFEEQKRIPNDSKEDAGGCP